MAEYYEKINWKDGADGGTPLSAENLNKMEEGISGAEMRTGPLEYDKENDTFSAGDRIQLDANGNLKVSGTITDGNGNSLPGSGGDNTNLPFFICELQSAIIENVGYFDVMHPILFSEFDADFLPTVFAPGAIKVKNIEYIGSTVGDANTPGTWYASYKIEFENIPENTEYLTIKLLSWKK